MSTRAVGSLLTALLSGAQAAQRSGHAFGGVVPGRQQLVVRPGSRLTKAHADADALFHGASDDAQGPYGPLLQAIASRTSEVGAKNVSSLAEVGSIVVRDEAITKLADDPTRTQEGQDGGQVTMCQGWQWSCGKDERVEGSDRPTCLPPHYLCDGAADCKTDGDGSSDENPDICKVLVDNVKGSPFSLSYEQQMQVQDHNFMISTKCFEAGGGADLQLYKDILDKCCGDLIIRVKAFTRLVENKNPIEIRVFYLTKGALEFTQRVGIGFIIRAKNDKAQAPRKELFRIAFEFRPIDLEGYMHPMELGTGILALSGGHMVWRMRASVFSYKSYGHWPGWDHAERIGVKCDVNSFHAMLDAMSKYAEDHPFYSPFTIKDFKTNDTVVEEVKGLNFVQAALDTLGLTFQKLEGMTGQKLAIRNLTKTVHTYLFVVQEAEQFRLIEEQGEEKTKIQSVWVDSEGSKVDRWFMAHNLHTQFKFEEAYWKELPFSWPVFVPGKEQGEDAGKGGCFPGDRPDKYVYGKIKRIMRMEYDEGRKSINADFKEAWIDPWVGRAAEWFSKTKAWVDNEIYERKGDPPNRKPAGEIRLFIQRLQEEAKRKLTLKREKEMMSEQDCDETGGQERQEQPNEVQSHELPTQIADDDLPGSEEKK